jgi:sensor histidine kinase regulating citrate/malate metabolism
LVIVHFTGGIQLSFFANILIILLQLSLLASSVLVFFIFDSALHKRELETQIDYYKYQLEQMKTAQTVIGRMEHDFEKHLLALKLDLKNAKPDEAEQKIDGLIGNLHLSEGIANSGNADVDAILNYKANLAKEYGIRVACTLRLPYTLNMNTTDLAVILGNAIDNAIEACKAVEAPERVITLSVEYEKSNLYILFSNPFVGNVQTNAAGEIVTTKTQGAFHGIGLKSIKETVDKYNGVMDIAMENSQFVLKIILFNLPSL